MSKIRPSMPENHNLPVKPFFDYPALVSLMQERGMVIRDTQRAERKIAQIGYYRFSGYSHSLRRYYYNDEQEKVVTSNFREGTSFEELFKLYLMDKQLRLEFSDALERIEVYLRTIIAHELGRIDPQPHLDKKNFTKDAFKADAVVHYDDVIERYNKLIEDSKEESITHHKDTGRPIPIWVGCETWDFGMISKFYSILNGTNKQKICDRIGVRGEDSQEIVKNWLINLNVIRNRCAHHARLYNRTNIRGLKFPKLGYFNLLNIQQHGKYRLYGVIAVVWFLLKQIGTSSLWIRRVADIVDTLPSLPGIWLNAMGFDKDITEFPRGKFPESLHPQVEEPIRLPHEVTKETFDEFIASLEALTDLSELQKEYLSSLPAAIEDAYVTVDDIVK
ncbi:Abi family protein [Vibrio vulnificus]|nr:Abi family protein [Vibrio vulnificus]